MHEPNNPKTALIISTLASFSTPFMASALNVALPSLAKDFQLDTISLSWVATAYLLSAATFLIPFGRLSDIHGRKKIFLMGVSVYSLFSLLIPFSVSGFVLIVLRAMQGIGAAMIFSTGMAILISVTPPTRRGRVLGINVAAVYLGLSLGPFLGGFLIQYIGWASIFYLNVCLGIFIIILTTKKLRGEWAEAKGDPFDIIGSLFFTIAFVLLLFGFSKITEHSGIFAVIVGFISLVFFILWEEKVSHPILNIRLFTNNAVFAFSNAAALINYSTTGAVTFLLSLYLQYIRGLSPQTTGMILVVQPIFMMVVSPIAGRLSDRIEPRIIASLGMALTVIGLFLFIPIGNDSSLVYFVLNLVFLGIGFGLFSSPNTNAVMSSVSKEIYGVASATLGTMRLTGQMLSMGIVMLIFSLSVGRIKITPEYYPQLLSSMRLSFIVFASFCIIGVFASLARGRVR